MGWLEAVSQNTARALYLVVILLLLSLLLIVVIGLALLWGKWASLPPQAKLLVLIAVGILGLMVALITGFIVEEQLLGVWTASVEWATHIWMRWDGWTRTNQWVGALLLALLPIILWPSEHEEE